MIPYRREVSLDLPCVHRAVRIGRAVVASFAQTDGLAEGEIETLTLAVSELLANAVDHGGGGASMCEDDLTSDVRMRLQLVFEGDFWRLEVEDSGGGDASDAADLCARLEAPDPSEERGRGLFLVRELVCELGVRKGDLGLVFFATGRIGKA